MSGYRYRFGGWSSFFGVFSIILMAASYPSTSSFGIYERIYTAETRYVDFDVGWFAEAPTKATLSEAYRVSFDKFDRTSIAYTTHNQIGQTWRGVVDAYRHIDPGRLLI